jgi:hypothetical protein
MKRLTQGIMVLSSLFSLSTNIINYNTAAEPIRKETAAIYTMPKAPENPVVPTVKAKVKSPVETLWNTNVAADSAKVTKRIADEGIRQIHEDMQKPDVVPTVTQIDRSTIPVPTMQPYREVIPQVMPGVNPVEEKLPPVVYPTPTPTPSMDLPTVYTNVQTANNEVTNENN